MVMIANLQYGWTLFVNPMRDAHSDWSFDFLSRHFDTVSAITLAFTIFIALETWLTPIEGWIVDNLGSSGPKLILAASWSLPVGASTRSPTISLSSISAPWWAGSVAGRSTQPASGRP
jgi:hypothetical protein